MHLLHLLYLCVFEVQLLFNQIRSCCQWLINTIRVSLGKRFRLGTRGAPAGVFGSGVDGPLRNQLLIAQMIKILRNKQTFEHINVTLQCYDATLFAL